MNRLHVSFAVLATTLVLGSGSALAAGPYPPPSKGTGHVEPSRIKAGECAVFSGDGFAPLTPVGITDNGASRGTATANVQGQFSIQLCYSSNAKRGRHDLIGTGTAPDGSTLSVFAMLIVQGVSQSASNPGTQSGGQSATTFGGGTSSAAEAPPTLTVGSEPVVSAASANSAARPAALGAVGLAAAFVGSLVLLRMARRRRRSGGGGDSAVGASPRPV